MPKVKTKDLKKKSTRRVVPKKKKPPQLKKSVLPVKISASNPWSKPVQKIWVDDRPRELPIFDPSIPVDQTIGRVYKGQLLPVAPKLPVQPIPGKYIEPLQKEQQPSVHLETSQQETVLKKGNKRNERTHILVMNKDGKYVPHLRSYLDKRPDLQFIPYNETEMIRHNAQIDQERIEAVTRLRESIRKKRVTKSSKAEAERLEKLVDEEEAKLKPKIKETRDKDDPINIEADPEQEKLIEKLVGEVSQPEEPPKKKKKVKSKLPDPIVEGSGFSNLSQINPLDVPLITPKNDSRIAQHYETPFKSQLENETVYLANKKRLYTLEINKKLARGIPVKPNPYWYQQST